MCVGKNDLTNGINMLNNAKKIVKELTTKLPKVKIAFSGLITRKDKKNLDKNVTEAIVFPFLMTMLKLTKG